MTSESEQKLPIRVDNAEAIWLGENQDFLEENYPGKWVAVKGRELLAVGDTIDEVLEGARKKGVANPLVSGIRSAKYRGVIFVR
jgi:hypothetical protein